MKARRFAGRSTWVPCGLLLVCLLAYLPIWVRLPSGAWPFGQDALQAFKPWLDFTLKELHRGLVPLWNPHLFCGTSFVGNLQNRLFYPPNVIYLALPMRLAFVVDALAHSMLLAGGAYLLARALRMTRTSAFVTAALLVTGGAVAGHLYAGHITWHAARAFLPWELWALLLWLRTGQRKYLGVWAGCWALQILAGSPPVALISLGFNTGLLFAYVVARQRANRANPTDRAWLMQRAVRFGLGSMMMAALVAIGVLPFIEYVGHAVHGTAIPYDHAVGNSATWRSMLRLLLPGFFGGHGDIQWSAEFAHEEAAYIGLLGLLLAFRAPVLAQRQEADGIWRLPAAVPWLWALLPIAGLLSLGDHLPFYHFLYDNVFLLRLNRVPSRWLEVWFIAAALLAGFSLDGCLHRLRASDKSRHVALNIVLVICCALCVAGALLTAFLWRAAPQDGLWQNVVNDLSLAANLRAGAAVDLRAAAMNAALTAAVVAGLGTLLLVMARGGTPQRRTWAARAFVLLLVCDPLLNYCRSALVVDAGFEKQQYDWPSEVVAQYEPRQRWSAPIPFRNLNAGMSHGVDILNGYDPLMNQRYYNFVTVVENFDGPIASYQPAKPSSLLRLTAFDHVVMARSGGVDWRVVPDNSGAWPHLYLSRRPVPADAADEFQLGVLAAMTEKPVEPTNYPVVLGPDGLPGIVASPLKPSEKIVRWDAPLNRVNIETVTEAPTALVQADTLLPGWRAYVNGRPAAIHSANYLFRAVEVPAGKSTVNLVYDPQSFRFGAFITFCGLALVIAIGISAFTGQRRAAAS